jgi:hypothetical protein
MRAVENTSIGLSAGFAALAASWALQEVWWLAILDVGLAVYFWRNKNTLASGF